MGKKLSQLSRTKKANAQELEVLFDGVRDAESLEDLEFYLRTQLPKLNTIRDSLAKGEDRTSEVIALYMVGGLEGKEQRETARSVMAHALSVDLDTVYRENGALTCEIFLGNEDGTGDDAAESLLKDLKADLERHGLGHVEASVKVTMA